MDNVIDLKQGPDEDGKLFMNFFGDKWRCAQYERRKAEDDTKRMETKQRVKDTI